MILELKDKISLADTLGEQSAMVSTGAADSKLMQIALRQSRH